MNEMLFHAAPAAVRVLTQRLSELLEQLRSGDQAKLIHRLVLEEHDRPQMVFTGQYSSGKSTLIRALTNDAVEVFTDSAVATQHVERFVWDGLVDLIDTPGVQAGIAEHDERALEALRTADLVLFAVSVDLFDDKLVEHLRYITEELRKAPQLLIVITKARTIAPAQEGIREAAVNTALGPYAGQVPWVECDAKTYLDGLHENDSSRAERRIEASGMAKVSEVINDIARDRGKLARFMVPLQQIAETAGEALAAVAEDSNDGAILSVLGRQRRALTNHRGLIESAFVATATEFRKSCTSAAGDFAGRVDELEDAGNSNEADLEAAEANLNAKLSAANALFEERVKSIVDSQLQDLMSEVREIEASPFANQLRKLDVDDVVEGEVIWADMGLTAGAEVKRHRQPNWAQDAIKHLNSFQKYWGAGDGIKQAAGSPGHRIVYKVGKIAGWKFQPWQAARFANTIGSVARAGNYILPIALEAYSVLNEERKQSREANGRIRRQNFIVGRVVAQCDEASETLLNKVRAELDSEFSEALREIDDLHSAVRASQNDRGALAQGFSEIQTDAFEMLDRLSVAAQKS